MAAPCHLKLCLKKVCTRAHSHTQVLIKLGTPPLRSFQVCTKRASMYSTSHTSCCRAVFIVIVGFMFSTNLHRVILSVSWRENTGVEGKDIYFIVHYVTLLHFTTFDAINFAASYANISEYIFLGWCYCLKYSAFHTNPLWLIVSL